MLWLWIILIVLVLVVALFALAGWYFFKVTTVRGPREKERKEEDFYRDDNPTWAPVAQQMREAAAWMRERGEMVSIQSYDGLKLAAFFVDAEIDTPKGTIVAFHGYRSQATVDFAPEVRFLHDLGYRLIVPYQRSHGESEGEYITYGARERYDARDWAKYAAGRWPGEDIFLAGISMGCATVTMAADLDLPDTVRGIVADCGFTSAWEEMAYLCRVQYHIPAPPILAALNVYTKTRGGYGLKEADSRRALANTRLPVLFIHGAEDDFVPPYMTQQNFEACASEKELYLVKGAGHAQSYAIDPQGCQEKMQAFFEKYAVSGKGTPA